MLKMYSLFAVTLSVSILITPLPCIAQFAGGSGTVNDPYQIATVEHLQNVAKPEYLGKNFMIVNNIDAAATKNWNNGEGFEPIGSEDSGNTAIYDYPWKNKKTKELFSISFPNHNTVDIAVPTHCTASIIDIRGSVIKDNVNGSVDIAHLGNRIYFAVIKKGGKIIGFKRFIKVENVLY